MTRTEFEENMGSLWDLYDFCCENNCPVLEDMWDEDSLSDYINENLMEWARYDSWQTLRDRLNDYYDRIGGYTCYVYDEYSGDYVGLTDRDDFQDYYDRVLEWCEDEDFFEDDDEEEPEESGESEEPWDERDDWVGFSDCTLDDMFTDGSESVSAFRNMEAQEADENDRAFRNLTGLEF